MRSFFCNGWGLIFILLLYFCLSLELEAQDSRLPTFKPSDPVAVEAEANKGNVACMVTLMYLYTHGVYGLPKDDGKAMAWAYKAAGNGNAAAYFFIAQTFATKVPPDYREAVKWYSKAAEKDIGEAYWALFEIHSPGKGAFPDQAKAEGFLVKAGERGSLQAIWWIYQALIAKKAIPGLAKTDPEIWLLAAAERRQPEAIEIMGKRELQNVHLKEAYGWFRLGSSLGSASCEGNRARLAPKFTVEELCEAEKLAIQYSSKSLPYVPNFTGK